MSVKIAVNEIAQKRLVHAVNLANTSEMSRLHVEQVTVSYQEQVGRYVVLLNVLRCQLTY